MSEEKYVPQKPVLYDLKEHKFMEGKQNGRMQVIQASPNVTLQWCQIRQPHEVGLHRHEYEQIVFVPEGKCKFWCDGIDYELDAGCFMVIPPNAEHGIEAEGNMYVIDFDIFSPKRSDRKQTPRDCDLGHKNWDKGITDEVVEE